MVQKLKILVIDDDEVIQMQIKEILRQAGYDPYGALDEKTGLSKAIELNPKLILLDRNFGEKMSGEKALVDLQSNELTKHIPIIMLTGDKKTDDIRKSLTLGAKDYVVKPCNPERLVLGIKKVLGDTA